MSVTESAVQSFESHFWLQQKKTFTLASIQFAFCSDCVQEIQVQGTTKSCATVFDFVSTIVA